MIAYLSLPAFIIRFRWLTALLVVLSLIMPHLAGRAPLPSPLSAPVERVAWLAIGADGGLADGLPGDTLSIPEGGSENSGNSAESGPENGAGSDPYSADYPYEMDKILALSSFPWGTAVVPWGGGYLAGLSADPVFPFERPPKPRIA